MIEELRTQPDTAHRRLISAQEAGLEHEVHQHRSRIDDLIEIAIRHGIAVKPWPDLPHITHVPSSEA